MCYCCEDIDSNHLPFEQFIRAPFNTTPVDPVTGEHRPSEGCPSDINIFLSPEKGYFENVMASRYEKFLHFLNLSRISAGFDTVQHEHVMNKEQQRDWMEQFTAKWGLLHNNNDAFKAVVKDSRFWKVESEENYYNVENRIARSVYLNSSLIQVDERARERCRVVNSVMNEYIEQLMGYTVLDC